MAESDELKGAFEQIGTDVKGLTTKAGVPGPAGTSLQTVVIPAGSIDIPVGTATNSVVIRLK